MAALTKTIRIKKDGKKGTFWRVDFYMGENRKNVRLGKMTKAQAETIKSRIEYLVAANDNGTAPDAETSRWVASIGDDLHPNWLRTNLFRRG